MLIVTLFVEPISNDVYSRYNNNLCALLHVCREHIGVRAKLP